MNNNFDGFYYIHFCDIDRRGSKDNEKRITDFMQEVSESMGLNPILKHTQYFSGNQPMDTTTRAILDVLKASSEKGEPTPIVLLDESLANAYDFIGRIRYGAVVLHTGKHIDKESLINTTSKYIDLTPHGQYAENKASRGHETIQIVRSDFFKFDIETAIDETRNNFFYAPCKWIPQGFQYTLKGDLRLLRDVIEDTASFDLTERNYSVEGVKFEIPKVIHMLQHYDNSLNRTDAERIIKRNKTNTADLAKQFKL